MHWIEKIEFLLLALLMASIPISFNMSLWTIVALGIIVVVKACILPKQRPWRLDTVTVALLIPIGYWIWYLISMFWTEATSEGWNEMAKLLSMPAVAACFLVSYHFGLKEMLTPARQRMLFWILTASCTAVFFVRLGYVAHDVLTTENAKWSRRLFYGFYYIHHSYLALYLLTALVFLYTEWVRLLNRQSRKPILHGTAIAVCAAACIAFLIFTNSRAGILCLFIVIIGCIAHLIFKERRTVIALIFIGAVTGAVFGTSLLLPESQQRLFNTLKEVSEGDTSDVRFLINKNSVKEAVHALPFGVGAGDRMEMLTKYYATEENPNPHVFNPHNQYVDSLLATGVIGLLLLFAMLAVLLWTQRANLLGMLFLIIMAVSFLFESILERQMGLIFWITTYSLLMFNPNTKQLSLKNRLDM